MKKTISATIDEKLAEWIDKEISKNMRYRNRSHLVEEALVAIQNQLEKKRR